MMTKNYSWPFMNGRYRIFYLYFRDTEKIYLIDIIDNRMLNKKYFPDSTTFNIDA